MTGSIFSRMTTMVRILRDFKPILDLDLKFEERITRSKIDLDLSAGLTYTRVYTVVVLTSTKRFPAFSLMFTKYNIKVSLGHVAIILFSSQCSGCFTLNHGILLLLPSQRFTFQYLFIFITCITHRNVPLRYVDVKLILNKNYILAYYLSDSI